MTESSCPTALHPNISGVYVTSGIGVVRIHIDAPLNHMAQRHLDAITPKVTGVSGLSIVSVEDQMLIMEAKDITDTEQLKRLFTHCCLQLNDWYNQLNEDQRNEFSTVLDPLESAFIYSTTGAYQTGEH